MQVRHARANLSIAEEDRMEAGSLEYLELAGMKHLHFANVVPLLGSRNAQWKMRLALVAEDAGGVTSPASKAASSELSTVETQAPRRLHSRMAPQAS